MSDDIRESIETVAVQVSDAAPTLEMTGDDYSTETDPLARQGAAAGVAITGQMIAEDPRALIIAPIVLPFAVIGGAIAGAGTRATLEQIRENRQDLSAALIEQDNQPLPNEVLADEVRSRLFTSGNVESVLVPVSGTVPQDVDAVLEVEVDGLTIDFRGGDASMQTRVIASLRRRSDNSLLYEQEYVVGQTESLGDWVEENNTLWQEYIARVQRYVARRISDDFFEKVEYRHVLRPVHTESFSGSPGQDFFDARVDTSTPTLAWELVLLGGDEEGDWSGRVAATDAIYDLEVYLENRLVYFSDGITATSHTVSEQLESCTEYRWSVRPAFLVDGKRRVGDWMIRNPNRFSTLALGSPMDAPERFAIFRTSCDSV